MSLIQVLFPFLAKIHFQKIVTAAALLGIFVGQGYFLQAQKGISSKWGFVLIFIVFWMVISIPFGIYPGQSFRFLTETFWKTLVLVVLTLAYSRSDDALGKIIWTYILAIGLLAIITVSTAGSGRLSLQAAYDPNDTALQFLMALPFAFWWFKGATGFKRILLATICLALLAGIVWTQSRGGFLGLFVLITVIIMQVKKFEKKGFLKVTFAAAAVFMIILYFGSTQYVERMSTIFTPSEDYNVTSTTGRVQVWKRGIDMILSYPVFGVGVANYITADGRLYANLGSRWQAAHNSLIQIGAELGLPGLMAFVYLIWSSVRGIAKTAASYRFSEGDRSALIVSNSLIGSWVGFIVTGSFLSAAYTTSFFFLLSLSIAFMILENRKAANSQSGTSVRAA